jgi:integrase
MTIPFFRGGFALPVDQGLLILLNQEAAKTELNIERLTQLTFNFRNPGYSAEQGGVHPVEIRLIRGLDGWLFDYVTDFEPYLLRHTFCTDCQAAGVPINVAKEWMGHSDISVTAKIYTHMVDEVFEQNRIRMAQYAVTKSQQVESLTATN